MISVGVPVCASLNIWDNLGPRKIEGYFCRRMLHRCAERASIRSMMIEK